MTPQAPTTPAPGAEPGPTGVDDANAKLLAQLNRPAYEQAHARHFAEGPAGPAGLQLRLGAQLEAPELKKAKGSDPVKGALVSAQKALDTLAKGPVPGTLDAALDVARNSRAVVAEAQQQLDAARAGPGKEGAAKLLGDMLQSIDGAVARLQDQKANPLNHLDAFSSRITNQLRTKAAAPSYEFMVNGKASGIDAQAYANRASSPNVLWGHKAVERKEGVEGLDFIKQLSKENIHRLEKELQSRGGMTEQDKEILRAFLGSDYLLSHSTDDAGKAAIDASGKMLSKVQLEAHAESGATVHNNTPKSDELYLRNHDFVFFRFEAGHASGAKNRYGSNTYTYEARKTPLLQTGWITMEDQLTPKVLESLERKSDQKPMRTASQRKDPENTAFAPSTTTPGGPSNYKIVREYPANKADKKGLEVDHHTQHQVFFGPDIPKGVALSVIVELKRIDSGKLSAELLGAEKPSVLSKFIGSKKAVPVDEDTAHALLKTLFRAEAKLPKQFFLPAEPGPASSEP